jgi:hypothetical protein
MLRWRAATPQAKSQAHPMSAIRVSVAPDPWLDQDADQPDLRAVGRDDGIPNPYLSAGTRAPLTERAVTFRTYNARGAKPDCAQILQPADVQLARTVTPGTARCDQRGDHAESELRALRPAWCSPSCHSTYKRLPKVAASCQDGARAARCSVLPRVSLAQVNACIRILTSPYRATRHAEQGSLAMVQVMPARTARDPRAGRKTARSTAHRSPRVILRYARLCLVGTSARRSGRGDARHGCAAAGPVRFEKLALTSGLAAG